MQQERQERQDREPNPVDGLRKAHRLMLLASVIWSTPIQMLMRKVGTMGRRYITWHYFVGIGWMFVFEAALNPVGDHGPMILLAAMTTAVMILHAVKSDKKVHTQFCGLSGLGTHSKVYTLFEPLVFVGVGICLIPFARSVGFFMLGAAVCSHLFHSHLDKRDAARLRAMSDAEHEQRTYMAMYRQEREQ